MRNSQPIVKSQASLKELIEDIAAAIDRHSIAALRVSIGIIFLVICSVAIVLRQMA